jgi:hypothetical protein
MATDVDNDGEPMVPVNLPQGLIVRLAQAALAMEAPPEPEPEPEPYVRQGKEFEPGTRVRLKGLVVEDWRTDPDKYPDDRWVYNDADELVRNPDGSRKTNGGNLSVDAPREGEVVRHEPPVRRGQERRHVLIMDDFSEIVCDFEDIEGVSEPPALGR